MIDRIRNFFKQNIALKLISVGIAFGIWLMVVNVSNPEMRTSLLTTVNIDYGESLTNLDKYYSLDSSSVRVSFSVRTNQRNQITSSDFYTYVDMRDYSITGALPVYVTVSDRARDIVSDVSVSPLVLHATTEDMQEKSFDLALALKGTPADGYAAGPANYSPSRVTLYGPNSEIGKISRVGFTVDVDGATDRVWGSAEFVYYDANDNPITPDVRIVVKNTVSYTIPIYKKKNVSITVQTQGEPAAGYSLDSVSCDPSFVEIYGDDIVTSQISAIILPAGLLNIANATGDVTATIDISNYMPDKVYTDTVTNIALIARISRNSLQPPLLNTPDGRNNRDADAPGGSSTGAVEAGEQEDRAGGSAGTENSAHDGSGHDETDDAGDSAVSGTEHGGGTNRGNAESGESAAGSAEAGREDDTDEEAADDAGHGNGSGSDASHESSAGNGTMGSGAVHGSTVSSSEHANTAGGNNAETSDASGSLGHSGTETAENTHGSGAESGGGTESHTTD